MLMHYMWWGALFPIDAHVCNVASMKDLLGHASAGPPSLSRLPSLCYGAVACHIKRDVAGDVHPYHLPMLQHCHSPVCAGNLVHLTIPPPPTDPHKSEQAHCSVKLHLHCRDIPWCVVYCMCTAAARNPITRNRKLWRESGRLPAIVLSSSYTNKPQCTLVRACLQSS